MIRQEPGQPQPPLPAAATGIARATLLGFAAEALVFPAGLVTAAFLTRSLGAETYGYLSLVYAVVSPVAWVVSMTFAGRAGVHLLSDRTDWQEMGATLLRANLILGLCAAALLVAGAPWIAASLGHPDLTSGLRLAAVEIMLMPLARLHRDAAVARGFYAWPGIATLAYQASRLALVLGLVTAGWSLQGVILANLAARALELAVARGRQPLPLRGSVPGGLKAVGSVLGSTFVYALCLQLFSRVDLLMLGWMGAPAEVIGQYGAAQNLAQAPGLFAMVLGTILIAALRRANSCGAVAEVENLRRRSLLAGLGVWAIAAPVAAGATPLTLLLFGRSFGDAGPMLGWLGVAAGAGVVLSVLAAQEVAAGRFHRPLLASLPMLVVAILLLVASIPQGGGSAAARAMAAAATFGAVIMLGLVRGTGLAVRLRWIAQAALAAAAGYLGTSLAEAGGMASPLDILLGCLLCTVAMLATGLVSPADARSLIAALGLRQGSVESP